MMKDLPKSEWSVEQLTTYCQRIHSRMAVDRWRIGAACLMVKDRLIEEGNWMTWVAQTFGDGAYNSIQRYMQLAEAVTVEELGTATVMEAYYALGIVKKPKKREAAPTTSNDQTTEDETTTSDEDETTSNEDETTTEAKPPESRFTGELVLHDQDELHPPTMEDIEGAANFLVKHIAALRKLGAKKRAEIVGKGDPKLSGILGKLTSAIQWLSGELPQKQRRRKAS